jgi:tetratricopeptide (TPR) repeat protein
MKRSRRRGGGKRGRGSTEAGRRDAAAQALWKRLEELSYAQQVELVESDTSFHSRGLCRRLHELSIFAASIGPLAGTQLANLALRICRHLDGGSSPELLDLQALGLACLGNARRALGELRAADDALDLARTLSAAGTGDAWVQTEIDSIEALLRCTEHRLGDAVRLLDRMDAYLVGREPAVPDPLALPIAQAALALKAWSFYHLGDYEAAWSLLLETERRAAASATPSHLLEIRNGLVWTAIMLRRWSEAQTWLAKAVESAESEGAKAAHQKLRLAEARIDRTRGERAAAERTLRQAAAKLVRLELYADAVLAWIELASLYVEEGDTEALIRLALSEMLPAFCLAEIGGEEVAYLMDFQGLCCRRELTAEAVAEFASAIDRSRRTPLLWWSAWGTVLDDEATGEAVASVAG